MRILIVIVAFISFCILAGALGHHSSSGGSGGGLQTPSDAERDRVSQEVDNYVAVMTNHRCVRDMSSRVGIRLGNDYVPVRCIRNDIPGLIALY